MKYPKIETLFKRDENFKITNEIRLPEFENIKRWLVTEKIDGTNIRIIYQPTHIPIDESRILFRGRTDNAQMPTYLLEVLQKMFTLEKFENVFPAERVLNRVCLYGEGYGAKMQKGGGNYNKGNSFRLFDVWIDGWWLEWDSVEEIAKQLEIKTAPVAGLMKIEDVITLVKPRDEGLSDARLYSRVALDETKKEILAEGIVARAYPMMLFRNGIPIKFKLKVSDYK